jgi:sorting nexin-1/2
LVPILGYKTIYCIYLASQIYFYIFLASSYKVNVTASKEGAARGEYSVIRRFSDFFWLYRELIRTFPGTIVPAIPEKQTVGRFENEFVEFRQRGLEKFIRRVIHHPELSGSELVATFLQADEAGLAVAMERTKVAKPNLSAKAQGWFEETLNTIQNSGKVN